MKRLLMGMLALTIAIAASLGISQAQEKKEITIKDVMKRCMKGGLCKKVATGKASDEEKAGAKAYVDELVARGGTATDEALAKAFTLRGDTKRPFNVVFLTDGHPTIGETDPGRILKKLGQRSPEGARVFVWGVGNEVNTHLLDKIAQQERGEADREGRRQIAERA